MSDPATDSLRLSDDHVRRATREVDGLRHKPGWHLLEDEDLDRLAEHLLADRPRPIPIFAYGSLIWNPDFAVGARRRATAIGWHRRFSIPLDHFRGTPEQPGLMLALASGGSCEGLIMEIEPGTERDSMRSILKRELVARELSANARWIEVETDQGRSEALTFYADPVDIDLADLPVEEQAIRLARANGVAGSGSEYLLRTAQGLRAAGIHDEYIWQLQELAAAEIESWPDRA
ncbi:gamma-glutamylcyclotransferase [Paracoccus aerodenitrificans]|uniref:gamma-glutamylcyclotransferase n=1 Tax=Paracoccus aerodenitrificans TaxID=3017781 RepID=UPI0022F0B87E|nr:gamma-glutamylcyclotransferase [Paracoccus aerodenitrificans]WBU64983.1 gamma-glutamylcyclotransferase [Paracoccus aerodenitrificans]